MIYNAFETAGPEKTVIIPPVDYSELETDQ